MMGRMFFILILCSLASIDSRAQERSILQNATDSLKKIIELNAALNKTTDTKGYEVKRNAAKLDSAVAAIEDIPVKYFKQVDKKIDKYTQRIDSKTEKTLVKLSKWEKKIKKLLDKASPETSAKLFGKNKISFSSLLSKLKQGEKFITSQETSFDKYRDKLSTSLKYIESQKNGLDSNLIKPVNTASAKMRKLDSNIANTDEIDKLIKERKRQLIEESLKYIGKCKYLAKINKESYYYTQTLRNYKKIFSDEKKAEQTALAILNKIPAFKKFAKENSMLASLFNVQSGAGNAVDLTGLQTRVSINELVRDRISAGGPNAQQLITQQMQLAQGELNKFKSQLSKFGAGGGGADMPDFKPNNQRSKTFMQRLQYGGNMQLDKSNRFYPATVNLGLSLGYKLNDKSIIGIGAAYKMGMGSIERIKLTHQGIGLRSFGEWKLKKQFFVNGGFEMNHNESFENYSALKHANAWQQSALLGITKKIRLKTKLFKGSGIQLMYDFFYKQHIPASQPVVFRTGYTF